MCLCEADRVAFIFHLWTSGYKTICYSAIPFILIDFCPQIGSYFGASLSLLDVDSDGDSDFLLVGAPSFYQSQSRAEGRLYIYSLSEQVCTDLTLLLWCSSWTSFRVTGRLLVVTIILLHWDGCCKVKVKKLKLSDIQPSMVTRTRNLYPPPIPAGTRLELTTFWITSPTL